MHFPFSKKSNQIIAPRLLFLILIFSGIVTLMITATQIYVEYERDIDAINDQFKKIGVILINPLEQALWFMNEDSIKMQLDGILNLRDIEYLELVGEGNIFITAGKKASKHTTESILSLTHRNDSGESTIGTLTVVASKTAIYSRLFERLITILVYQSIIIFLLSVFIFLIVHHLVIKHLSFISNYLKGIDIEKPHSKIALQRTSRRVKDELDQVVISINEMNQRQKDSYRKIEQVVMKRTSELTQKNEQLKKERQKVQKYLDVAGVMLVALNISGEITLINKQGCKLLKTSETDAIGKNWFEHFLPKRKLDEVKGVFEQLMDGNIKPVEKYENPVRTSNGDERIVAFNNTLLLDAKDRIEGVLFSGEDITAQKKLETQLQQSQKMEAIATLAGGVAHEFNNTLMGIMGNIELLKMDFSEDGGIDKHLESMKSAGHRMSRLTAQLLAYAEGGKYQLKNLKMDHFVIQTLPILQHNLNPEVRIETHFPKDISYIKADYAQMQMVLSAILANANEAIEDEGLIRIAAKNKELDEDFTNPHPGLKPGPYVYLTVEDDGKGMDEETRNGIFEPFFTTKFQGRGMGMAAVYGIVKNHDGWISVDSELEKGTAVQIYLPAIEIEVKKTTKAKVEVVTGSRTILMIEDEDVVIEITQAMLEMLGYRVMAAKNGKDAIHITETFDGQIDLALLDIKLPDIDGRDLYPLIMKARSNLKVIVFSGYSIDGPAREILDAGAQDFIQKPFSLAALSEKLKVVLEGK